MIGRKPKPKSKVKGRVKKMFDEAANKGEAQYQSDLSTAKRVVNKREEDKKKSHVTQGDQRAVSIQEKISNEDRARSKAAYASDPVGDVKVRKSSGMYRGSVPVAGTSSKKLMRKHSPMKGIRKSAAKASVKRSMIRQMR